VLLPTLAFVGLVTFERVLQSGIEDIGYARRIARVRGYYFDAAPELTPYLLSAPSVERLSVQGVGARRGQRIRTVAGMVALITAVLAGCVVGVLAAAVSDGSVTAAGRRRRGRRHRAGRPHEVPAGHLAADGRREAVRGR
jgi:hypothetical protein